jgi:hypothetical protein
MADRAGREEPELILRRERAGQEDVLEQRILMGAARDELAGVVDGVARTASGIAAFTSPMVISVRSSLTTR